MKKVILLLFFGFQAITLLGQNPDSLLAMREQANRIKTVYEYKINFDSLFRIDYLDAIKKTHYLDASGISIQDQYSSSMRRIISYVCYRNKQKLDSLCYLILENKEIDIQSWQYDSFGRETQAMWNLNTEQGRVATFYRQQYIDGIIGDTLLAIHTSWTISQNGIERDSCCFQKTKQYYDQSHRKVKECLFNEKGQISEISTFIFNEKGDLQQEVGTTTDGSKKPTIIHHENSYNDGCFKKIIYDFDKVIPENKADFVNAILAKNRNLLLEAKCSDQEIIFASPDQNLELIVSGNSSSGMAILEITEAK